MANDANIPASDRESTRPSNCANPLKCEYRKLETDPPTDYYVCFNGNCPNAIRALRLSREGGENE